MSVATYIETALNGSHEETQKFMSAYAEGELRGLRRWRVGRHLTRCEICKGIYRGFLAALDGLRKLRAEPPADPRLADSVVDRIRREKHPPHD